LREGSLFSFTNQSIIIWTLKTKFLLTSLYRREELPLFGYLFPAAQAGKRGEGRFPKTYVFFIAGSLVIFKQESLPPRLKNDWG